MTLAPSFFSSASQNSGNGPLPKIAIVGRGFTGMMTAIALLKGLKKPFHLVMFDPQPKIDGGEGLRHSTATLLNSRVRDLSVDPEIRDDFRKWLDTGHGGRDRPSVDGGSFDHAFVSGEIFSIYVYQRFSEALRARTDVVVQVVPEAVTAIDRSPERGMSVSFNGAQVSRFDAVLLCTGFGLRDPGDSASPSGPVRDAIVIGGGTYAVDRALRLLISGEALHVTLISSSGYLPQPHARAAVGRTASEQPMPSTLRGAFRYLREAANAADEDGSGWQGIMNGFRSRARDLWQGLTPVERKRFKRHVKPIYDSHRNRLPPEHYQRLHQAILTGAITVKKGKVERIATNGVLFLAPTGLQVCAADRIIDCRFRPADLDSPLFRSLFRTGLAKRDEIDLGILVDGCGRAMAAPGAFEGLFAMGPLGLGSLPDIDLVPEIVVQAHAAAAALEAWSDDLKGMAPVDRATAPTL